MKHINIESDKKSYELAKILDFRTGCVLDDDCFALIGYKDEYIDYTINPDPDFSEEERYFTKTYILFFRYIDNEVRWVHGALGVAPPWHNPMVVPIKNRDCLAASEMANCVFAGSTYETEIMIHAGRGEDLLQEYKGLKNIKGSIYVVGKWRSVLKRLSKNQWIEVNQDVYNSTFSPSTLTDSNQPKFTCIDGFEADKDLYAAGNNSELWHYDGQQWTAIDLGIRDLYITAICCAGDGYVYLGTANGILIKGKKDNWRVIKSDLNGVEIKSLVWFKDTLYILAGILLYKINNNKVLLVDYKHGIKFMPLFTNALNANDKWLISVASGAVAIFDGKRWHIILG